MNYVQIMGGLGNQLFQYVYSKYLENKTGRTSVLFAGIYGANVEKTAITARDFSLDKFNTHYDIITEIPSYDHVETDDFANSVSKLTDNIFFNGYWQNKEYFFTVRDSMIDDLTLRPEYITDEMSSIADKMENCESVSIHLRHSDYLNQYNSGIFEYLSPEYYKKAVNHLISVLGHKPVLYIFSDDYDYISFYMTDFCDCETHIMEPRRNYEDLYLMSKARHHVIANSTYSWWGAMLSTCRDGITIAPTYWYKDKKTPDLYPDSWITINNKDDNARDKPLVSVIIPAYNVETYIDECLKSIALQTYGIANLEIILIDDASTDSTFDHLQAFESAHEDNVILIRLDSNSGQGAARNIGLEYASGEYITYVDSDDLIDITLIEKLILSMEIHKCDMVECGHKQFFERSEAHIDKDLDKPVYLDLSENNISYFIALNCAKTAVWGRLYKKDFLIENNIRFEEGLIYEDILFTGTSMFLLKSYYRINETLYYYRCNHTGTVFSSYKKERVHQVLQVVDKYLEVLKNRSMIDDLMLRYRKELVSFCVNKSFIDPLALLLRSSVSINEIFSEIKHFKNYILGLFPDAVSCYYLSDSHNISSLALYLLNTETTKTEMMMDRFTGSDPIIINTTENYVPDKIIEEILKITGAGNDRSYIAINREHYDSEHLLLKHAANKDAPIFILTDKYRSRMDQRLTEQYICSVISEYTHNPIVVFLEDILFDESDELISHLALTVEKIRSHGNMFICARNAVAYELCRAIMPDLNIVSDANSLSPFLT